MGNMKVTIRDIARRVQVSKTLVSLYLNRHPLSSKISRETKKRIDEAVRELGYRPSFAARALAKGRTGTVGMIIGNIRDPFSYYLVDLAMREIERSHRRLLLMVTEWKRENRLRCLESLLDNGVDGLFCCVELPNDNPFYEEFRQRRFPIVSVNRFHPDFSCVYNDFSGAVADALSCCAEHRAKSLDLISGKGNTVAGLVKEHAERLGIRVRCSRNLVTDSDLESICKTVLRRRPPFLFLTNCRAARVLVREIREFAEGYFPNIITVYTLPSDVIDDSRIIGAVQYRFSPLVTEGLALLNNQMEHPETFSREECVLPARFLRREQFGELETLGRYNFRIS